MRLALLAIFAVMAAGSSAQPLQTIYYPDGGKAIEGHWRMSSTMLFSTGYFEWSQRPRIPDHADPDVFATLGKLNSSFERALLNLHPDGLVTTWYDHGGKQKEITFLNGEATGPFTEYYFNGNIAQQGVLERGMPSGPWTTYDINGEVYYTGNYVPFTDSELAARWQTLARPIDNSSEQSYHRSYQVKNFIEAESDTVDNEEMQTIRPILQTFSGISPGMMSKREGTFRFYHRHNGGGPLAVLCYRNNLRDSIWSYWESPGAVEPTISLEYRLGVLLSIRDKSGKRTVTAYVAYKKAEEERARKAAEREERHRLRKEGQLGVQGSVTISEPPQPRIYRFVEQNASFNGNLESWQKANLQYPRKAWSRQHSADITVRFLVDAEGMVSEPRIVSPFSDDDDYEAFNKEALRLMSIMPPWRPYRINTKGASSIQMLTFHFRPDSRRK